VDQKCLPFASVSRREKIKKRVASQRGARRPTRHLEGDLEDVEGLLLVGDSFVGRFVQHRLLHPLHQQMFRLGGTHRIVSNVENEISNAI